MDVVGVRLACLLETVALEAEHLQATDQRLFAEAFTVARAATLRDDAMLSERLDAFIARFARLQDTARDKLLPVLRERLGEAVNQAHEAVPMLVRFVEACQSFAAARRLV